MDLTIKELKSGLCLGELESVMTTVKDLYNNQYKKGNYFAYREWLFRPYISSLMSVAGLEVGSSILDVGCGQGFFSYLLQKCGMNVFGIDVSETGVRLAKNTYGFLDIEFVVGDANHIPFSQKFDCVFSRSLSLYNNEKFSLNNSTTDYLLKYVKEKGIFIFSYNTNFNYSKRKFSWRYHTLKDVKQHFLKYKNHKIFFISKIDTLILRKFAFNCLSLKINSFISKNLGLGGDLVCIIRKQ